MPDAEPRSVMGASPEGQRDGFSLSTLDEMRAPAAGPGKAFASLTRLPARQCWVQSPIGLLLELGDGHALNRFARTVIPKTIDGDSLAS